MNLVISYLGNWDVGAKLLLGSKRSGKVRLGIVIGIG